MNRKHIAAEDLHALLADIQELRNESLSSQDIADRLSFDRDHLTEIETKFCGMNNDQIQHLLSVERDLERLTEENRRLRDQIAFLEETGGRRFD